MTFTTTECKHGMPKFLCRRCSPKGIWKDGVPMKPATQRLSSAEIDTRTVAVTRIKLNRMPERIKLERVQRVKLDRPARVKLERTTRVKLDRVSREDD